MLLAVPLKVNAKVAIVIIRIQRVVSDGVELMVTHDRQSSALIDHRPDYLEHASLVGTPVDEVAEKDDLSIRVSEDAVGLRIAEFVEKADQRLAVPVDVAD